jgi:hypothetical protein
MVDRYGPEVITMKLAKIASRNGNTAEGNMLKGIFPTRAA